MKLRRKKKKGKRNVRYEIYRFVSQYFSTRQHIHEYKGKSKPPIVIFYVSHLIIVNVTKT